jgi:hypothetical protein
MCKPSCCPGQNRSSLGTVVAAVAALAVLSAAARPLIHAAELVLQAALITIGAAVTLAAVALVTILVTRVRRSALRPGPGRVITVRAAVVPRPPARTWAQAALADRIHALGAAPDPGPEEALGRSNGVSRRCPACGITPCERRPGDARQG